MTGEVIKFFPKDAAKDPDAVLEQAMGAYKEVLVLGWDEDGQLDARGTNLFSDGGEILWLIEQFKMKVIVGDYQE